ARSVGTAGRASAARGRLAAGQRRRRPEDLARHVRGRIALMDRFRRIYQWDPGFWRCALVLVIVLAVLQGRKLVQGRSIARLDMYCDDALWRESWCAAPIAPLENADYSPAMVNFPYEWWNAQQLRHGRLPAWNPMVGAGQPSRVTFQGAALNPM